MTVTDCMKQKEFIELICAGCDTKFLKDKKVYEEKRRWGRSEFFHTSRCAIDSRMEKMKRQTT